MLRHAAGVLDSDSMAARELELRCQAFAVGDQQLTTSVNQLLALFPSEAELARAQLVDIYEEAEPLLKAGSLLPAQILLVRCDELCLVACDQLMANAFLTVACTCTGPSGTTRMPSSATQRSWRFIARSRKRPPASQLGFASKLRAAASAVSRLHMTT
jgi:hypothetical protein